MHAGKLRFFLQHCRRHFTVDRKRFIQVGLLTPPTRLHTFFVRGCIHGTSYIWAVTLKIQSLCDNKLHIDKSCKSIKFLQRQAVSHPHNGQIQCSNSWFGSSSCGINQQSCLKSNCRSHFAHFIIIPPMVRRGRTLSCSSGSNNDVLSEMLH